MAKTTRQRSNDQNQNNTTQQRVDSATTAQKAASRASATPNLRTKKGTGFFGKKDDQLVIGRENYKWALIGIAIMAIGYICMSGGSMPSPDIWDESIIYSPMRIIVAPFLIIAGLVVVVYSIFVKNKVDTTA